MHCYLLALYYQAHRVHKIGRKLLLACSNWCNAEAVETRAHGLYAGSMSCWLNNIHPYILLVVACLKLVWWVDKAECYSVKITWHYSQPPFLSLLERCSNRNHTRTGACLLLSLVHPVSANYLAGQLNSISLQLICFGHKYTRLVLFGLLLFGIWHVMYCHIICSKAFKSSNKH